MISRRAIAYVRRHDWAAVAIELTVVIVGVFIGLQASNWNEDRETDRSAAVFSERLSNDLRAEAWAYEVLISYHGAVLAHARRAADALSGGPPLSDEALLVAAYRATQYNSTTRRRATYDELTSTGGIGLIREPGLRDLSMRVYTDPEFEYFNLEGKNSEYRHWFRLNMPHEVQRKLSQACGDRVVTPGDYKDIAHMLDYPCSPGLSPAAVTTAAAILRNDQVVLPLLRLRIADVETSLSYLTLYSKDMHDGLRGIAGKRR